MQYSKNETMHTQMNGDACHTMDEGEILNAAHPEYPLHHGILYGDRVSTAKFSKRLSCAIKHLPIRVQFHYEYDTLKAVEQGVGVDPTFVLDGEILFEGLVAAEAITERFEALVSYGSDPSDQEAGL